MSNDFSPERDLQKTFYDYKGGIAELAAQLGRTASWAHRVANPNDTADMPLLLLVPLLDTTKDFRILRGLCRRFGFVMSKIPRRVRSVGVKDVAGLQARLVEILGVIVSHSQGAATRAEARAAIYSGIEALVAVDKLLENGLELPLEPIQPELPFSEGARNGR